MFQCRWSGFERVMSCVHLSTLSMIIQLTENETCYSYFMEMLLFKPHKILRSLTDLKIHWLNCVFICLANVWFAFEWNVFSNNTFGMVSSKAHYMAGWFIMCRISLRTTRRGHCHVKSQPCSRITKKSLMRKFLHYIACFFEHCPQVNVCMSCTL